MRKIALIMVLLLALGLALGADAIKDAKKAIQPWVGTTVGRDYILKSLLDSDMMVYIMYVKRIQIDGITWKISVVQRFSCSTGQVIWSAEKWENLTTENIAGSETK